MSCLFRSSSSLEQTNPLKQEKITTLYSYFYLAFFLFSSLTIKSSAAKANSNRMKLNKMKNQTKRIQEGERGGKATMINNSSRFDLILYRYLSLFSRALFYYQTKSNQKKKIKNFK